MGQSDNATEGRQYLKQLVVLSFIAGFASAALTFLPWVGFGYLDRPSLQWNGLGAYVGTYPGIASSEVGVVNVAGWIVLSASLAAVVTLIGALRWRWLRFVACGLALVTAATAAACLAFPALAVSDIRDGVGVDHHYDRHLLNSAVLIAEVATTTVLACATLLSVRRIAVSGDKCR